MHDRQRWMSSTCESLKWHGFNGGMFLREMLRRGGFEFDPLFGGVSPMRF